MLPVQQMFGGGAMNPTPGMAMNPLLQGFGSYQNMQDQFTNTGLNQQSQDIANQAAEHALEQSRLGDPLAAAQRERDLGAVGIDQTQINSGEALKTRQAQDQAKQSKAYADMSQDDLVKHENGNIILDSVMRDINSDPDYLMNPEKWKHDKARLEAAGFHSLPNVADHDTITTLSLKAANAQTNLKSIQAAKVAQTAQAGKETIANIEGGYRVKAAEAGFERARTLQENSLPDDVKVLKAAGDEYNQNGHTLSETTYAQVYNVMRQKERADPAVASAMSEAKLTAQAESDDALKKDAAANKIPFTTRANVITALGTKAADEMTEQRTKAALAQRFPDLKVRKSDGTVVPVSTETKRADQAPMVQPAAPTGSPAQGVPLAARDPSQPLPPGGGAKNPAENLPTYTPEAWKNAKSGDKFVDPVSKEVWKKK